MSNALAIAGVTAVLKDLLDNGLIDHAVVDALGAGVLVTSLAPDLVPVSGDGAGPRLNLFLYQATPNAGWRNVGLPSADVRGTRVSNPPLALDLHYLLTAYGAAELEAEVLLGFGLQMLHQHAVLTRKSIRTALIPEPVSGALLPPVYKALRSADLADQVELLKITPAPMNTEEMSRLWSALTAHYRPSAAFQVSVVLIEPRSPAVTPLPVLTRGKPIAGSTRDEGVFVSADIVPPYPALDSIVPPVHATPSTLLQGETVAVRGHRLAGTARALVLHNDRFGIDHEIALAAGTDEESFDFAMPTLPAALPAGLYQLQLRLLHAGDLAPRASNSVPVALAPAITSFPPLAISRGAGNLVSVRIGCQPDVRVGQAVSLLMDGREAPAKPFTADTAVLDFDFADAPPAGATPLLRLKVDGIESVVVDRSMQPPVFFNHRITLPP